MILNGSLPKGRGRPPKKPVDEGKILEGNAGSTLPEREEQLRSAEKILLEEQRKLSNAQNSLLEYEQELRKREMAMEQLEQERGNLDSKLKAVETGKIVLSKFCAALKDILLQLEQRAKTLQEAWIDSDHPTQTVAEVKEHFSTYEQKSQFNSLEVADINSLSHLVIGVDAEKWCIIVSAICQRFVSFLARETFLKEWALSLEKEAIKLQKMEQDIIQEKASSADQSEHIALLLKTLNEEKKTLAMERESLAVWATHIQDCRKAVAESEKAAAVSLAEVQKKAADLSVQESSLEEKYQQIGALDIQLKTTTQDLQNDKDIFSKQKLELQNQSLQMEAKEKDLESQLLLCKRQKKELAEEWKKIQEQRIVEAKEREDSMEKEEKVAAKELVLRDIEKDLEGKVLAVENLARKLNAREKLLKNIKKQNDEERLHADDLMTRLEMEKKSIEETKAELEISKKNVNEAWERIASEHQNAAEHIKSAEEKMKEWENRLKEEEKELLQQQDFLKGFEVQFKSEQQRYHTLHSKIQKEQEKMAEDLKAKEDNVKKWEAIIEKKEDEMKKSLQKLLEKRNLAELKLMQLKEIEARTESLEEELHKRHEEHLHKVDWHAKEYQAQLEQLEIVKHDLEQKSADVDRRFQEVRITKKELNLWQKEAKEALDNQAEGLSKEKDDLELQKQNLKNLQHEIERAGARMIDHMMNLDQASAKIELLRHKLDASQQKLQMLFNHTSQQQKFLNGKEKDIVSKEQQLETSLLEWKRRDADSNAREEILNVKEQALKSRENDLNELESKLRVLKENQQNSDVVLQEHYTHAMEKVEIPELLESLQKELQEHNKSRIDFCDTKRREHTLDRQAETSGTEIFHQETARIIKERENLKAQQHELEETKNAVQDAKLTLAAQLRATKEMVVDASITAHKASREREALEQERKRLAKAQKEIETSLAAREAKIFLEEQKIEKDRCSLEDERKRAMDIICQAEQMKRLADNVETSGKKANQSDQDTATSKAMHGLANSEPFGRQRLQMFHNAKRTHPSSRFDLDMINLWREEECAKIEREEKMIMDEISRLHNQHQDDFNRSAVKDMSEELELTPFSQSRGEEKDGFLLFHEDDKLDLQVLQSPRTDTCDIQSNKSFQAVSDDPSDGLLSRSEAAFNEERKLHNESLDMIQENFNPYFEEAIPSKNRLENVMTSLVNARQASRSRLQRTKNLLQTVPLSGGLVSEVHHALGALTDRLSLMEQMEDELTDQLREVYRIELPDSEGMIVDKVELLCRMEEQQTLRAEWEEDMQCQLEKISLLQANSQGSSCFSTPIKRIVFDRIVSPLTNKSR